MVHKAQSAHTCSMYMCAYKYARVCAWSHQFLDNKNCKYLHVLELLKCL